MIKDGIDMTIKYYENNNTLTCGITLKDSTKEEDFSLALHTNQNKESILKNRKEFITEINSKDTSIVFLQQTHSKNVSIVHANNEDQGFYTTETAIQDCDALLTNDLHTIIGVFTADCVPILLYAEAEQWIGAIHAGWKSTSLNIVKETLDKLEQQGVNLSKVKAWVGPSIQKESFEVQKDILPYFKELPLQLEDYLVQKDEVHYLLDVTQINIDLLKYYGIRNIYKDETDTFTSPQCFSYRRNKDKGRHFSFITLQ